MQVRLTGKDDWGAVPGERVASISGRDASSVSGAMKDLLGIVVKDPDSSLNKSLKNSVKATLLDFQHHIRGD